MNLTPDQQAAVRHRGSSLLLSASAGSGKTEVLARRCVDLLTDATRPCSVDRLLVVTFTRAAAAELRVRIARMLRATAARVADLAVRRHLRRQEALVPAADIGTIDAWCGRLVREFAPTLGVDPAFTTLSEADARLLRRAVLDDLLRDVHRGTGPFEAARAWLARAPAPDDGFLRDLITRLNTFREHLVNPEPWLAEQRAEAARRAAPDAARHAARAVLASALRDECAFQRDQLAARLTGLVAPPPALQQYGEALAEWARALAEPHTLDPRRFEAVLTEIRQFRFRTPRGAPPTLLLAEVEQRWFRKRLRERWEPAQILQVLSHAPRAAEALGILLDLEAEYHRRLTVEKQRRAVCEFADVLRLTLDLLGVPGPGPRRAPTAIAEQLRERYEHVLIDEFQDTSPVQVEILRLVTRDAPGHANAFLVGDIKQSIYGFRQAEPRLFTERLDAYETGREAGCVRYLADNFRSHGRLLAGLNGLFRHLFDRHLGGTDYGPREQLRAGREARELPNPTLDRTARIVVRVLTEGPRRGSAQHAENGESEQARLLEEKIEREARLAAAEIQRLLAAGTQVAEKDGDALRLRALRPADIAILLRSAARNAAAVARVLRAAGIRCTTGGREALLDATEVRDVRVVLQLLTNRRQDVPLAAYLRGPLVGLDDAALLAIRTACPDRHADFYAAVERFIRRRPDPGLADRLTAALEQLERWAHTARDEDVPAVLRRILTDGALPLWAAALPDGEQRVARLRALQSFADAFARSAQGGVAEFVEYLDTLAEEKIEPPTPVVTDNDVVKIMTIHQSKGLEFPVVLLLAAGNEFNMDSQSAPLHAAEDIGIGLRYADYEARAQVTDARHLVLRRHQAHRELEEELRLLYVALTRAREHLIIIGHAKPQRWEEIRAEFTGASSLPLITRLSVPNRLEWVLLATAAGRLYQAADHPPLVEVDDRPDASGGLSAEPIGETPAARTAAEAGSVPPAGPAVPDQPALEAVVSPPPTGGAPDSATSPSHSNPAAAADDEAWHTAATRRLAFRPDLARARQPAVLAVSALKEAALRDRDADMPHTLDSLAVPLALPPFAVGAAAATGADVGTACHRFLERADLRRLSREDDIRAQLDEFRRRGELSDAEAALVPVADIAWFGNHPLGRLLATQADTARREVPFVYALDGPDPDDPVLVRGIIDCLVPTPRGLVILDYKTDRPRDATDRARRIAAYTLQMQVYGRAAAAIFARPAVELGLVFLYLRQVETVAVLDRDPPLGALLDG